MDAAFAVLSSSAYDWEFLYHGEFRDKESQLYNYGYRYLDTQLGRWLSRDPIGEEGGLNLYQFIRNRSSSTLDVLGLRMMPNREATPEIGGESNADKAKREQDMIERNKQDFCGEPPVLYYPEWQCCEDGVVRNKDRIGSIRCCPDEVKRQTPSYQECVGAIHEFLSQNLAAAQAIFDAHLEKIESDEKALKAACQADFKTPELVRLCKTKVSAAARANEWTSIVIFRESQLAAGLAATYGIQLCKSKYPCARGSERLAFWE